VETVAAAVEAAVAEEQRPAASTNLTRVDAIRFMGSVTSHFIHPDMRAVEEVGMITRSMHATSALGDLALNQRCVTPLVNADYREKILGLAPGQLLSDSDNGERCGTDGLAQSIRTSMQRIGTQSMLSKVPFGSCAVVGSSGILKGSSKGAFIDSHDVVIRMNIAPTAGHELDVGSRPTVRVWAPLMYVGELFGSEDSVLLMKTERAWSYSLLECMLSARDSILPGGVLPSRINAFSPSFYTAVHALWLNRNGEQPHRPVCKGIPTTGLVAILWALHACNSTSTFGFGGSNEWYFDKKTSRGNAYVEEVAEMKYADLATTHDIPYELQLLDDVERMGLLTRHR
jgi:hypothetical protein